MYTYKQYTINQRMLDSLKRYEENGTMPGGFLQAILSNDLIATFRLADDENLLNIPAFVYYVYNEMPYNIWGSRKIMTEWVEHKSKVISV